MLFRSLIFLVFCFALVGCDKKNKVPLAGHREQVFMSEEQILPDQNLKGTVVHLPSPVNHPEWTMAHGNPAHLVKPGMLNPDLKKIWDAQVGTAGSFFGLGSGRFLQNASTHLLNGPISADGKVFTIDAHGLVIATNLKTGEQVWATETISGSSNASQLFSGGLAYEGNKVYAATAQADVFALEAQTGKILWRAEASAPIRSAPTVKDGRVFVANINNQLEVFDARDGHLLWSHTGTMENASLLGGASPAVDEGVVVVPYSSGEVFALKAENGYPLWSESLQTTRRLDSISSISHIKATPVIDGNLVFLVGYNGRMSALDLPTGKIVWSKVIGGSLHAPAVAGQFVFVLTTARNMVCLKRDTGQIVWVKSLSQEKSNRSSSDASDKILWAGPVLAENSLIIAGSHGQILFLKAQNGDERARLTVEDALFLPPILVHKTLVFLTNSATLMAYH